MIVDCHTHVFELGKHLHESYVNEFEAKSGFKASASLDARPEKHYEAMKCVDKAIVLAVKAPGALNIPNEYVSEYVESHPEKLIGFASVDPYDSDAKNELKHCVNDLGLKGLKLYGTLQKFYFNDPRLNPLYETAQELEIPVLVDLSTTFMQKYPLRFAQPILVDDVAVEFPDLTIIIAHMGMPNFLSATLPVMRKNPNVYADISTHPVNKPFLFTIALEQAMEYGAINKLLFASDYPFTTPEESIKALKSIPTVAKKMGLPEIGADVIQSILEENSRKALKLQ
jgi:hypothetical protein